MKKYGFITVFFLFCVLLLVSCATTPKPTSSEDCLVLIRSSISDETNQPDQREYKIFLSDRKQGVLIDNMHSSFIPVLVKKPGVIMVRLHTAINGVNGFIGNTTDKDFDFDLPYTPGKMVIAHFAFIKSTKLNPERDHSYVSYFDFKTLKPEEISVLQEQVSEMKQFSAWEF